jgi:hypothetical protein
LLTVTLRRGSSSVGNPAPLVVAASLCAVEGGLLVAYAVLELFSLDSDRLAVGLTTAIFFGVYGVGLALCALAITRRHAWARSPLVLAQLIQLGLAWSFLGGGTTALGVAIGVVAIIVLIGLLHPASIDALADQSEEQPPG